MDFENIIRAIPQKPYYLDLEYGQVIYCADCRDILPLIPDKSIDLVLTDPPYGATALEWDIMPNLDILWVELKRVGGKDCAYVFTATQPFTTDLINSNRKWFRYEWIWVKNTSTGMMLAGKSPMRRHENILVFSNGAIKFNPQKILGSETSQNHSGKGYTYKNKSSKLYNVDGGVPFVWSKFVNPHSVLPCNSVGNRDRDKVHSTQKPIALIKYLVNTYTNRNDMVLDPFLGSGTTACCAKKLNRKCIGIEIEEKYCEIAKRRLAQSVMRLEV